MAAPARAPKSADARIPCPLCGGPIHPIAGRCKHCKADLSALRGARPAAQASLPSLIANGQHQVQMGAPQPMNGHANGVHVPSPYVPPSPHAPVPPNGNGHAPYAPGSPSTAAYVPQAAPLPLPVQDGSQPILPPRPTGRMYAAAATGTAWWKSWPLIVIILAALAIVTAVVLMVWPPGGSSDKGQAKGSLAPPPAPERMDTNPLPPSPPPPRTGDPWNNQGNNGGSAAPNIDIPDDPDPGASTDPGYGGNLTGTGAIMMGMMRHACDRAAACGPLDSTLKDYCEMTKSMTKSAPPASCPAAKRCFDTIDAMSCGSGFDDITALSAVMYKFQDCVEAMSC